MKIENIDIIRYDDFMKINEIVFAQPNGAIDKLTVKYIDNSEVIYKLGTIHKLEETMIKDIRNVKNNIRLKKLNRIVNEND